MAAWRLHRLSFRRRGLSVGAVSCAAVLLTLLTGLMWTRPATAFDPSLQPSPAGPDLTHWPDYLELPLAPLESGAKWIGAVIPPPVFSEARLDLGDLRLFDQAGHEVPYAMRILQAKSVDQEFPCREFNRAVAPDKVSELTLDLGAEPPEHNEVDVRLPGVNFRRRAVLDASPDGGDWRRLLERQLFYFQSGDRELRDLRLAYPPSRFRYLRLRIEMDPAVDKEAVDIEAATVHHRVEVPGESVSYHVALGDREPIRTAGSPGSAWIVELGADYLPCDSLQVDVAEAEFARDYAIEAGGPAGSDRPFARIASGQWSRRGDESRRPLTAVFPEQRAARLRLVITDYSNPPLDVTACHVSGAAREVVFSNLPAASGPLRLYYGNLKIEPPHYDLERNLPARLDPPPVRLKPGLPQPNASYIAERKPFSERWPWAIYAVLSLAGIALAAIIVSLGRAAVAMDDARQTQEAGSG